VLANRYKQNKNSEQRYRKSRTKTAPVTTK
jgi:hypothetical protein